MAMQFQQMYGSQGYEVTIRTDFDFQPDRTYMIGYYGIYGEMILSIVYPLIDKHYTKFVCKAENRTASELVYLLDDFGAYITDEEEIIIIL